MARRRLFSGVQPSGRLHLGNYLGAIKQWIVLQEQYDALFCVVDLHAITVPQDPKGLRQKTLEAAKMYMALGVDVKKAHIFVQSDVSAHAELAWILNTVARMSDLDKMTQFKDKSEGKETVSVGLYDYPVLMAADILLYDTDIVPVGDDQVQHLELTRTLANRFNKRFKTEAFRVPRTIVQRSGARIMGLDNPGVKMSKSAASEYNFIALDDTSEAARKKIMRAVTDSGSEIELSDSRPAIKNLLSIFGLLESVSPEEIAERYKGKGPARNAAGGYAEFKKDLADSVVKFLEDFQKKYGAISDGEVREVLEEGRKYAQEIASEKMKQVKEVVGLGY